MANDPAGKDPEKKALQDLLWLVNDVDQLVEHALAQRLDIQEVIPRAIDRLLTYVGADAVTVRVPDEDGESRDFTRPQNVAVMSDQVDRIHARLESVNSVWHETNTGVVYGQRLDLRVEFLGTVVAWFTDPHDEEKRDFTQRALFHWAEVLDNFVATVAETRLKQQALERISDGFKHPILENAIDAAIQRLLEYVDGASIIVACQSDEVLERASYCYRFIIDGELEYSSSALPDPRVQALVESAVERLLRRETVDEVLEELHFDARFVEDVPILALDERRTIGRVVVGSNAPMSRFASDLIDRFADYLRQRVVDFSREWRVLSHAFSKDSVERLMREPSYDERYLAPREAEVAILYADIAGFTRLCEQVLVEPDKIGRLVERWSRHVVGILWDTGGVFDKLVGDCVIGLWGPPFYETSGPTNCAAALDAARRIRDYTELLSEDSDFPEIAAAEFPVGVATGLHYTSVYVGQFGLNEDFTAFGSGMNLAARLQGVSSRGEVLATHQFVETLGTPALFGEEQSSAAKNVAEPIRYHRLLDA